MNPFNRKPPFLRRANHEDNDAINVFSPATAINVFSPHTGELVATFYNEHFLTNVMQEMFDLSPFDPLPVENDSQ